jgi:hypothetical protein
MTELELKRENRKLKKNLKDLTKCVGDVLACIDKEMSQPSTNKRGKRIAKLANALDMANDSALHFGLGLSFKEINKVKNMTKEMVNHSTIVIPDKF